MTPPANRAEAGRRDAPHSFSSDEYYSGLRSVLAFEFKSWLGRTRGLMRRPPAPKEFLNIGCGANLYPDFTNVDFYSFRRKVDYFEHDLRRPFPFRNETFRGVFSEHCIEHFYPREVQKVFAEILRLLVRGGIFRCIVPDLAQYVRFYNKQSCEAEFAQFDNGCHAIWNLTQNWGHRSVWDAEMLTLKLREAGFVNVTTCSYRKGVLNQLVVDSEDRRWSSLYTEAQKP